MRGTNIISDKILTGERALFSSHDLIVRRCTFADGESPLKESADLEITDSLFQWKYPLWYCKNVRLNGCTFFEMARAGVWYTEDISFSNGIIHAPKNFRRSSGITLENVFMPNASETLWDCTDIKLRSVCAKGDYFAMNVCDTEVDDLDLVGDYGFDGAENITIRNSKMITKDAFWNSKNVTVIDSFISGEYLGWNAKNLTLINCTIESLQGLCYIDGLVMKNCRTLNTTLAFEYSTVDVEIAGKVDSVFNPSAGVIRAGSIGELTLDPQRINPAKIKIITDDGKTEA